MHLAVAFIIHAYAYWLVNNVKIFIYVTIRHPFYRCDVVGIWYGEFVELLHFYWVPTLYWIAR